MSKSGASAHRYIFPPPAYCAYTTGAIPVPSTDTRPATETNAYPKPPLVLVNPPPPQVVHMADAEPRSAVFVSPYPASSHKVLPDASAPVSMPDPEGPKSRRKVTRLPGPL